MNEKVTCDVVKDLMPVYIDDCCSEDTKVVVESHIETCEDCAEELKTLSEGYTKVQQEEKKPALLKKMAKRIKKKYVLIALIPAVILVVAANTLGFIFVIENAFPDPTPKQSFSSVEEAMQAYGDEVKKLQDHDYDVWPPYDILFQQDCGDKVIVMFSYYYDELEADDLKSADYMVQEFKKNPDGSISFDDFSIFYPDDGDDRDLPFFSDRCFVNVNIDGKKKVVEYYYLPIDSDKDVYVSGVKAEKTVIKDGDREFYLCYVVRDRNLFIEELFDLFFGRYKVKIK